MTTGPGGFLVALALLMTSGCGRSGLCDDLEGRGCDECRDGTVRCSFGGVEATRVSCDGCQARFAVYDELCARGSTATMDDVDAGMVCEVVDTGF